jgi:hypothetical protein
LGVQLNFSAKPVKQLNAFKPNMENFSLNTRLTPKEYAKIMYLGLYKKPSFLITTIAGLILLVTVTLDNFKIIDWYVESPYFEIFSGIFLMFGPSLIVLIAIRQFISNPSFKNEIKYTFGENGMEVEGLTFKGEFLWSHIIKQREISHFLILYHSKQMGIFIDKKKLTTDQLLFIKQKVSRA